MKQYLLAVALCTVVLHSASGWPLLGGRSGMCATCRCMLAQRELVCDTWSPDAYTWVPSKHPHTLRLQRCVDRADVRVMRDIVNYLPNAVVQCEGQAAFDPKSVPGVVPHEATGQRTQVPQPPAVVAARTPPPPANIVQQQRHNENTDGSQMRYATAARQSAFALRDDTYGELYRARQELARCRSEADIMRQLLRAIRNDISEHVSKR